MWARSSKELPPAVRDAAEQEEEDEVTLLPHFDCYVLQVHVPFQPACMFCPPAGA